MDTLGWKAACGEVVFNEASSTAETLVNGGSAHYIPFLDPGAGALKSALTETSIPIVNTWLQDISEPCIKPPPGFNRKGIPTQPSQNPKIPATTRQEIPLRRQAPTGPRSTYATVLSGKSKPTGANISAAGVGPGPQPLRGIPGFPGQQAPQNRTAPLGSGRLQNGKIGNGSTWGFGMPVNGAPGLPNPQSRPTSAATTSFAQTIGGSQPATPLDLSEFPSLSGAPRPQYQNPGQAVWANANQRATQHIPVQRPQQQPADIQIPAQEQPPSQQPQEQTQQTPEDLFPSGSQFSNGLDDYRHGGQGGVGQLSGSSLPQTGNIDEFPPLSRNDNGDIGQDRRGNLMQNAAFGGYTNGNAFAQQSNQMQNRQALQGGQQDSGRSSTLVDRILSPSALASGAMSTSRSPAESMRQSQGVLSEQDLNANNRLNQNGNIFSGLQDSQMTMKPDSFTQQRQPSQPQQTSSRLQQQQGGFGGDLVDSPGAVQTPDQLPLSQMSELDRFGLAGILAMVRNDNQDLASLAIGQDLTQLGLDLNSSDPLYPTFASPFAESGSRPMQPEFNLPQCYTVHNVHKLDTKVPSFSDETLFYMFYTMPRDVMQEVAAGELTNRNWRYHKDAKMWLTKDVNYGDPTPISPGAERGSYIFFDPYTWQRTRREFILRYDALDNHIPIRSNGAAMA
ncbi:hypothetical protein MMC08_002357 [Hypocenomyce scalaris]|nr:hypothetical protein [Hypocenomyce scalaris]